ncbi:related to cobalt accumulation protein COT1 [Rhynchosporium graminicola]|uniref:Related to cobalt accumulation protein COT1 n=1 Tax=Rhynchosporium graminicola TaxID=2792576 RepID=A0A1E1KAV9_9HELO|nr:related to cobalt accumulation protein COT1 [Rhynchosporium commune]
MLGIDAAFLVLELGTGIWVGSLALMADAFHMLNDIISLIVGLWAVKAAQKSSTDKYSFGWLRAEILGAFFNAVFLIALCVSIVLEAVQRLLDPPEISNPMFILIVGSLGLASNLAGFLVLGGHGHSHGPEEHDHGHDEISSAEEGHSHGGHSHSHSHGDQPASADDGPIGDIYPEAVVGRATCKSRQGQHIRFSTEDSDATTSVDSPSKSPIKQHRRRTSSIKNGRYSTPDDFSIHPASFRKEIIAASRLQVDEDGNTTSEDETVLDGPDENSPLLAGNGSSAKSHGHDHAHEHSGPKPRSDSWHAGHNHNKPKKAKKDSHGHNHADMGMNAMILHVIGDALGNVGVIVSALIIWQTNWSGRFYADPAVSLFITLIILKSTIPLTFATAKILLQATPDHLDVTDIKEDIQELPGVISCHHVHIWQLSDTQIVASMHIQVEFPISEANGEKYMELAKNVRKCLHAYGIHSATIQPEFCLDKAHDHTGERPGAVGLDGIVGRPRCGLDYDDTCLLECVDDCTGKGCCSSQAADSQHDHSSHDGHAH